MKATVTSIVKSHIISVINSQGPQMSHLLLPSHCRNFIFISMEQKNKLTGLKRPALAIFQYRGDQPELMAEVGKRSDQLTRSTLEVYDQLISSGAIAVGNVVGVDDDPGRRRNRRCARLLIA